MRSACLIPVDWLKRLLGKGFAKCRLNRGNVKTFHFDRVGFQNEKPDIFVVMGVFKIAGIVVLLATCRVARAQTDSIQWNIDRLTNAEVSFQNARPLVMGAEARFLLRHNDSATIRRLVDAVSQENKAVVVHVLLTRLLQGDKKAVYNDEDRTEFIVLRYSYNGLDWVERYNKTELSSTIVVSPAQLKAVERYWRGLLQGLLQSGGGGGSEN